MNFVTGSAMMEQNRAELYVDDQVGTPREAGGSARCGSQAVGCWRIHVCVVLWIFGLGGRRRHGGGGGGRGLWPSPSAAQGARLHQINGLSFSQWTAQHEVFVRLRYCCR